MSSSVDSRILTMKIDNRSFLDGVANTITALAKLKTSMNFSASTKGLNDLQTAGSRFNMGGIGATVDGVSAKFVAMSTVAITALANITNRAVDAGINLAKSLTITPLTTGLQEYETQLNSVQTILANTQASGATLKDVNATLDELNQYADKTIYNFGQMAKNIGTFTAAGVDLDTSAAAIKGIANLAALSGSNSEQASTAMYQLSQAISAGRVSLQDWNSVVNAGMGGTVFQRALAQTAEKMGTLDAGAVKLTGKMKNVSIAGESFRESVSAKPGEKSWLTSEVLTQTLKQFTGDLTDAQLKSQGFNEQQIKDIQAMAKTAQNAATEVKTFTGLVDTTKESLGSGWASTWEIIIGDFKEAKKLWTGVSGVIGGIVGRSADARNKMLAQWKKRGGRDALLDGIKAGWEALAALLTPIREAFRDICPKQTGKDLAEMTKNFRDFMQNLKIGSETAEDLKRTFRGVFAIFSIIGQVIKGVIGVFADLFGVVGEGSGGFLQVTGNIGDMLVALDAALKKGGLLNTFFSNLSAIIAVPIELLKAFIGFITSLFTGVDPSAIDGVSNAFNKLGERFGFLANIGEKLGEMFARLGEIFGPIGQMIGEALGGIGEAIASAFSEQNFDSTLDAINTGLLAAIALLIGKFFRDGFTFNFDGGGALSKIGESFDALTGSMKAMQTQIQAKSLLMIAGAIGLLTASVVALSLIDSEKLKKALVAMSVGFGQLLAAMGILIKISSSAGFIKVPMIAASMVLLAGSIFLLTGAIALMGQLDWETIGKGLTGIAGALIVIGLGMRLMPTNLPMTAAGLALMGVALTGIAGALALMGQLSWETMGKGLAAMAGALAIIAATTAFMGPSLILVGPGLVTVGIALGLIAGTMTIFAGMSWEEIAKSMVALAGSLGILAAGLALMSGGVVGATALLIVAPALLALGATMSVLGKLSWEQIAKGLVALGGALLVLAAGLTLMIVALPGAAALLVVAPALAVLAAVMVTLGNLSWENIAKGLAALAGALTIIGVAGLVLTPIMPALLGLGASLALIGVGMALAGAGALAFATAFTLFAAAGAAGVAAVSALIGLIPEFAAGIAAGVVAFIVTIANSTGEVVTAMTNLLLAMLNSVINVIPKIRQLMVLLITNGLQAIRQTFPNVVKTGFEMLMALLSGIEKNIGKIVEKAVDIAVKFMDKLGEQSPRLIEAGVELIKDVAKGVAEQIIKSGGELFDGAKYIGEMIINGILNGLDNLKDAVINKAKEIGSSVIKGLGKAVGVNSPSTKAYRIGDYVDQGLVNGLDENAFTVVRAAENLGNSAIVALGNSMSRVGDVINSEFDMSPTIAPVLDLTALTQEANKIGSLLEVSPIAAKMSFDQASAVSAEVEDVRNSQNESDSVTPTETKIELQQNNYSPKPLDPIEVYRNTKSLISLAKEELNV